MIRRDSIAFADWYMDAHACTLSQAQGSLDEGKMMLHHETFPAQIPYRSLLSPEVDNLLVPVCLSSTHVAWGAIRLEPTWMQIGESAGYACAQARKENVAPANIDADRLIRTLSENHSMISFFNDMDLSKKDAEIAAAQILSTRGFFHDYDARLDEPLKQETAAVWLNAFSAPKQEEAQTQITAKAVAAAERGSSPAMTREAWHELLQGLKLKPRAVVADHPFSRGEALADLAQ